MTDDTKILELNKYRIEEMKTARQRIDAEILSMNQFEFASFAVIGAVYILVFQYNIRLQPLLSLLAFFPVILCAYGIFRYRAHADVVKIHEEYIKENIESHFYGEHRGLVGHYDNNKRSLLKYARMIFWGIILLIFFSILIISIACPEMILKTLPTVKV
jgi:Ca2+/Na+ antiporter